MAEPDQPKKETVRIELPRPPVTPPRLRRLQVLARARPSGFSCRFAKPAMRLFPLHRRPATRPLSAPVRPPSIPPSTEPKKETARIPLMSEPLRSGQKDSAADGDA